MDKKIEKAQKEIVVDGLLSIAFAKIENLLNWGRKSSLFMLQFGTACCSMEMVAAAAPRWDFMERSGMLPRAAPRHSDLMIVAGTVTTKMAPAVELLWEQMPEPKWSIAMGSCAIGGGTFKDSYSVIPGVDTIIPVDVYVPGCPPRPEALMHGILKLQEKIMGKPDKFNLKDARMKKEWI